MQYVQEHELPSSAGLRERKRAQTYARIQGEGMRLFLERGFEATTLDDVAAAAAVSRRTLFHYFGSKEEIVFSTKAGFPDMVRDAIAARPADESLLDMVENGLTDMANRHSDPRGRALARLIRDTPSLRAGDQAKYEAVERVLASALADRKGLAPDDLDCRITAAMAIGILKLSIEAWLEGDADDNPQTFGREAFAALRRVTR